MKIVEKQTHGGRCILSYYWYVWALYREACGAIMGESLYNWHVMAKRYSRYLVEKYGL